MHVPTKHRARFAYPMALSWIGAGSAANMDDFAPVEYLRTASGLIDSKEQRILYYSPIQVH